MKLKILTFLIAIMIPLGQAAYADQQLPDLSAVPGSPLERPPGWEGKEGVPPGHEGPPFPGDGHEEYQGIGAGHVKFHDPSES